MTAPAPGPSITIGPDGPPSSSVLVRAIVCGLDALKTVGSNWITVPARFGSASAWPTTIGQVARIGARAGAGVARKVDGVDARGADRRGQGPLEGSDVHRPIHDPREPRPRWS